MHFRLLYLLQNLCEDYIVYFINRIRIKCSICNMISDCCYLRLDMDLFLYVPILQNVYALLIYKVSEAFKVVLNFLNIQFLLFFIIAFYRREVSSPMSCDLILILYF